MLRSQLSIMGLYNYDDTIFDAFKVPKGMEKETAIAEILSQCAELELVYPDFDVMKMLIKNWTTAELPIWERAYKTMTIEYNPIWNKDGKITETLNVDRHYEQSGEGTVETKNDNTVTKSVQGYNTNGWADAEKDHFETKENKVTNKPDYDNYDHGWETTTRIEQGNIGVTTSQFMVESEIALLDKLNPYQFIVECFKRRFCLLVY